MDGAKGPVYTDPDIFENGEFSPFSKNTCPHVAWVFQSFSPVHTKKLNNGNMIISLTGHVLYDV